jgi:N-acetyl-alpha-D-glucosaminyl L-malate synthase BshA
MECAFVNPGIEDLNQNGTAVAFEPAVIYWQVFIHSECEHGSAPMKIGITCYPTYGGSGVVGTELGIELAQRGHEVHFIAYQQPIRLNTKQPRIFFHEVTVSQYPLFEYPPYDLALATRMAEVAEIYNLDILHVHYAIPHSVSALLARQMLAAQTNGKARKLPFVTTLHGTDITIVGADRSYLPVTRYSIEHYLKQVTLQEFEIRNHIEVIHNFVNCDIYKRDPKAEEARAEFAGKDERILVHVSNFRPVKRICDVIEIFDRVHKKIPSRLLLMGDGPDRSQAEWLVNKKGLRNRVEFLGKVDRVYEKLSISDLMLMPSEMESFGLAALEGMACELPSVATAVGGVSEVIEHGRSGFLAEVGDVETMAGYAIDILSDEKRLREMGKVARWEAQSRFCSSRIIPEYERFYERVLERAA